MKMALLGSLLLIFSCPSSSPGIMLQGQARQEHKQRRWKDKRSNNVQQRRFTTAQHKREKDCPDKIKTQIRSLWLVFSTERQAVHNEEMLDETASYSCGRVCGTISLQLCNTPMRQDNRLELALDVVAVLPG
jgi:hypothetical protein